VGWRRGDCVPGNGCLSLSLAGVPGMDNRLPWALFTVLPEDMVVDDECKFKGALPLTAHNHNHVTLHIRHLEKLRSKLIPDFHVSPFRSSGRSY